MSDLYEPFERLVAITILGRVFRVPENNLLLRQMQYVAPDRFRTRMPPLQPVDRRSRGR